VDRTGLAEFLRHPEVGLLTLHCQVLLDPDQSQSLLVYTATPAPKATRSCSS
jgi:hypothetical protein